MSSPGPQPRLQSYWDWRAAGNFIGGGAGAGLLLATQLSGLQGGLATALVLAGLALVGLGLLCVWFEIGRPMRALNVFLNVRGSWMSREAVTGTLLMVCGLAVAAGLRAGAVLAVLAAAYIYCQARIAQAARGIPAWREPLTVWLLAATAIAEGTGLLALATAWQGEARVLAAVLGVLLAARSLAWYAWRSRLQGVADVRALRAIDESGHTLQWLGTATPLALLVIAGAGFLPAVLSSACVAAAGLLAAIAGGAFKLTLITRAAYTQGYSLPRMPVRGVPR